MFRISLLPCFESKTGFNFSYSQNPCTQIQPFPLNDSKQSNEPFFPVPSAAPTIKEIFAISHFGNLKQHKCTVSNQNLFPILSVYLAWQKLYGFFVFFAFSFNFFLKNKLNLFFLSHIYHKITKNINYKIPKWPK